AQFQALAGFCKESASYLQQNIDSFEKIRERLRLIKPALKKVIVELNTFEYFPHNDRQLQYQRYGTRLPEWIKYSDSSGNAAPHILDYRRYAGGQFRTLAMLCELAQDTTYDARDIFLERQIVNSQVISEELFQTKMDHLIETWKKSTSSQFKRRMELIQITTMTNHLMSRSSIYFQANLTEQSLITEPRHYGKCNCGTTNHTCIEPMKIYETVGNNLTVKHTISNFFMGCYLIEALFLSTLECFYNESCMTDLHNFFHSPLDESWIFPALNSNLSRSAANESIKSIVDELMIDDWSEEVNFTSYYNKCAPSTCFTEYSSRQGLLTIATIIAGIFGGLSIGFQLFICSVNPSRFPDNSTFEDVFSELMMEELIDNVSYEDYFNQCAPSLCVHSYIKKSNLLEGITTIISLYGGVVIICNFVAVAIVKLLRYRSDRVTPTTN
ncbi:unnamed protein product, partial [Adineta steineri]